MTIIDAHVHMGIPSRPAFGNAIAYSSDDVLRDMDRAGVDRSLIMPIPHVYDNDYVAESARRHPDRFTPWAYVDPWHIKDPREAVGRFADLGFLGIKFRAVSLRYSLSDHMLLDPIIGAAQEFGLRVSMHTGDDPACTPLQVQEMAQTFPEVKFLLVHAGFRLLIEEALIVAQRCPNVYLDQTAGNSWQLYRALEVLGGDRIIYGSDAPFMDTRVEQVRFRTAVPDEATLARLLGGNAANFLDLPWGQP